MTYSEMLRKSIDKSSLSLTQIVQLMRKKGIKLDRAILSKMKNGKYPPAKDAINIALAEILKIDQAELRLAAIKERVNDAIAEILEVVPLEFRIAAISGIVPDDIIKQTNIKAG